jgi:hypothetical protein
VFWATKEKAPRQTGARLQFSNGRLAVFNVEQVTLNRHVQIYKEQKQKARAKQRRLFEISLAV